MSLFIWSFQRDLGQVYVMNMHTQFDLYGNKWLLCFFSFFLFGDCKYGFIDKTCSFVDLQ